MLITAVVNCQFKIIFLPVNLFEGTHKDLITFLAQFVRFRFDYKQQMVGFPCQTLIVMHCIPLVKIIFNEIKNTSLMV